MFVIIKAFSLKQIKDIKTYGAKELFRKFYLLVRWLLKIPIFAIAILPCIIIRLLRPWVIVRIEKVPVEQFGHFCLQTAIYYCKKKLKIDQPKKKQIDLVYQYHPSQKHFNKQLLKMWKRKLTFLPGYLLDPINKMNKLIPGGKVHGIDILALNPEEHDFDNIIGKYPPLDFTNEEEIYGKEMLNKFGLKDSDKFVCLAVRDHKFQEKKILPRFRDWSYQYFRNYNIDDFVLAAEELTKRGYYVLRMGVVVNKPINSNNPKIIDYANSNLRSDFMDIYLGAKCSFCLSTRFGFDDLPQIFNRPLAVVNNMPAGDIHAHREDFIVMIKHHVLKKEKRRLTLSEIFSNGVAFTDNIKFFDQKGIELVDNTPEEIRDVAIEMVEKLEFNQKLNPEDEELQKTFRRIFASNIKRFNYHKNYYRKFYGSDPKIKSSISTKFLRENKNWLN